MRRIFQRTVSALLAMVLLGSAVPVQATTIMQQEEVELVSDLETLPAESQETEPFSDPETLPIESQEAEPDSASETQPAETQETEPDSGSETQPSESQEFIAKGDYWELTSDGALTVRGSIPYNYYSGYPWETYKEQVIRVVLEDVPKLPEFCFRYCYNLREVVGMEQLQQIDKQAFMHCRSLESIVIPEGITTIPANCFGGCTSLKDVTLPSTLTEIAKWAFQECAFESINVPDSVVTFGEGAFNACRNLKTLEVTDQLTAIPTHFISGCHSLESFTIPEGVTRIGDLAFFECYALKELILPPGLTYVGEAAIGQCTSLSSLTIPGSMTDLPASFGDVPGLQTVVLEEGVETIPDWALANNPNLELLYLPASVTSIADTTLSNSPLVSIIGMPGSYAEEWATKMGIPFAADVSDIIRLKASVLDEKGAPMQSGYEIRWYKDGEAEPFATGVRVIVSDLNAGYSCQILLEENLCHSYRQPQRTAVDPENGGNITFRLESIPTVTVTGQVTDPKGLPVRSSVRLTERFDNGYTREQWFETDDNGCYSWDVSDVPLDAVFSADNYRNSNVTLRSVPGGAGELPAVILYPASNMDVIHVEIQVWDAVLSGEQSQGRDHPNPSDLSFHIYNNTRSADVQILSYESGKLYFNPNHADPWDNLTVTIEDRTGLYNAQTCQVSLNHIRVGNVWASMYQRGSVKLNPLSTKAALVLVFDASGNQADAMVTDTGYTSPSLKAGDYHIAVMEQNPFLRSAEHIDQLAKTGLEEGRDYLIQTVRIADGNITDLGNLSVPVLDVQRLCHTDPANTRVAINLAETSVGQYVLAQVRYALKSPYSNQASGQTVEIELPEGLQFVGGALSCNGMEANFEQTDRALTVYTDISNGIISFYVLATQPGTHTVNASLRWQNGATTYLEPLGSAVLQAENATINSFDYTSRDSIMLMGNALAGCLVQVYEGQELLAETTTNAAGRWRVDCPLTNYGNYQSHELYAVISGEALTENVVTATKHVIYDADYVELVDVTMYNTAEGREQKSVFGFRSPSASSYFNVQLDVYPTFTFELEFDGDASRLSDVKLTIYEAGGGTETLEPRYVSSSNTWIATTTITDTQKVPVNVGVGYYCDPLPDSEYGIGTTEKGVEVMMDFMSDYNAYMDTQLSFDEPAETEDGALSFNLKMEGQWESVGEYRVEDMNYSDFAGLDLAAEGYLPLADSTTWYTMNLEQGALEMWLVDPEVQSAGKLVAILNTGEQDLAVYAANSIAPAGAGSNLWYRFGEELPFPVAPSLIGLFDAADLNKLLTNRSRDLHSLRLEDYLYAVCPNGERKLSDGEDDMYFDRIRELWAYEREQWNRLYDRINNEYLHKLGNAVMLDVSTYGLGKLVKFLDLLPDTGKFKLPDSLEKLLPQLKQELPNVIPNVLFDNALYAFQRLLDAIPDQPLGTTWGDLQNLADNFDVSGQDYYHDIMNTYDELYRRRSELVNDIMRDWDKCEPPKEPPQPQGPSEPKRYGIDPAGFVYEAVPSNRLPGATVTVYYQADENIGAASATMWDAENYDQRNPLVTDANGEYAWYVPFGMWQVKAEMSGYETGYSDWLPVPPPQMEVHIGLISTAAPAVEALNIYSDSAILVFSQYMNPDSVYNAVTLTENGQPSAIRIEPMNAEYDLAGENQYATRFRLIPSDGSFEGMVSATVSADVYNYAGTAMGKAYISPAIQPMVKPENINMRQLYAVMVGQTLNVNVTLLPGVADQTLMISTGNDSFLNLTRTTAVTDAEGNASFSVKALLPGTGYITVTEPVTGLTYTAQVNITVDTPKTVGSVTATLENGTTLGEETNLSAGTKIRLTTDTPDAEIRYTTDGTCPCRNGAMTYTQPLVITEDTLLMAAAVVDGVFGPIQTFRLAVLGIRNPFEDVPDGQWFTEPVLWAVEKGITTGTSATTFSPDTTCTRAQVVTFLWRTMGKPEPESQNNPFFDVKTSDYYYNAVLWAVENGITTGTSATTFSPDDPCTRDQVVTFLWRTMGKPQPENRDNPFEDILAGAYYYDPVLWAVEKGVTSGVSAASFDPSGPCTRAQVVTFLFRTMQAQ